LEIYRESVSTKAFLLSALASLGVFLVVTIRLYLWLSAEELNPHPRTAFPPSWAFFVGLAYAIPTAVIVFVCSAIIFCIVDVVRKRREKHRTGLTNR
jgi:uncharacterized BrkB/YihY/UPF0761 family membrane protein